MPPAESAQEHGLVKQHQNDQAPTLKSYTIIASHQLSCGQRRKVVLEHMMAYFDNLFCQSHAGLPILLDVLTV